MGDEFHGAGQQRDEQGVQDVTGFFLLDHARDHVDLFGETGSSLEGLIAGVLRAHDFGEVLLPDVVGKVKCQVVLLVRDILGELGRQQGRRVGDQKLIFLQDLSDSLEDPDLLLLDLRGGFDDDVSVFDGFRHVGGQGDVVLRVLRSFDAVSVIEGVVAGSQTAAEVSLRPGLVHLLKGLLIDAIETLEFRLGAGLGVFAAKPDSDFFAAVSGLHGDLRTEHATAENSYFLEFHKYCSSLINRMLDVECPTINHFNKLFTFCP